MAPALYVHRKGANVIYGHYYYDYKDTLLLGHYSGKGRIDLDGLKRQYDSVAGAGLRKASVEHLMDEKRYFDLNQIIQRQGIDEEEILEIIQALDENGRWLTMGAMISHPYSGDGKDQESTHKYATTHVGDQTDTSPCIILISRRTISLQDFAFRLKIHFAYILDFSFPSNIFMNDHGKFCNRSNGPLPTNDQFPLPG